MHLERTGYLEQMSVEFGLEQSILRMSNGSEFQSWPKAPFTMVMGWEEGTGRWREEEDLRPREGVAMWRRSGR